MADPLYISVVLNIDSVVAGIEAMEDRASHMGHAFFRLRKAMRTDQRNHATAQMGPDGKKWPKKKFGSSRKLLGKLPSKTAVSSDSDSVWATSKVIFSGIHQEGGMAGHKAKIPQRQFLWISDPLMDIAESTLAEHVIEGFRGP